MEEYRDLHLTVELFCKVLNEPEFFNYSAGIVLQSYLPDSFHIQKQLTEWAIKRVASGGAPIKIRLVKGANLGMERVESSLRGWPQAPYRSKLDVDANFKRMVEYGCEPERAQAVRLGIGSHNLFDIAYAFILRAEKEVEEYVSFEMLEGMADPMSRVVKQLSGGLLLYFPATKDEDFENAVSYLMRRLDENTAPENFLRYQFDMKPGSAEWNLQEELFNQACVHQSYVSHIPRRTQNRLKEPQRPYPSPMFINESDTDFSLEENRKWAKQILENQKTYDPIPLVIDGKTIHPDAQAANGTDPSKPGQTLYRYAQATEEQLEVALAAATKTALDWGRTSVYERAEILEEIAHNLRRRRGELIAAMIADAGKTIDQADVEISEAIDFADYYRRSLLEWNTYEDISWSPLGVALITPPWNFPVSIPCGGILAALATGNTVLFKPAPEATLCGWLLAKIIWESGVSQKVLQFIPCSDDPEGSKLIKDPRVNLVVLTGSTETAKMFMSMRPGLNLVAETGGKNALIVTAMADRDQAIKDILNSAFGYSGQKCSACSLAILEAEVYDSPKFRRQLREAAASLHVDSAWNPKTKINPLRALPNPDLLRGLTQLDDGEEWLLEPKQHPENPQLWSPGIKLGVRRGSFTHTTELFGPVLGLMRADNLAHAIELANSTPYGLTSGIHTLDDREKKLWMEKIVTGNGYINRGITGAIVFRQPFGGVKSSSFGPGAKAGGPNYLAQMMRPTQNGLPKDREKLAPAIKNLSQQGTALYLRSLENYSHWWKHYFSKRHNLAALLGQDNYFFYKPRNGILFRVQDNDTIEDILRVIAAAKVCNTPLHISSSKQLSIPDVAEEDENTLIEKIQKSNYQRIRMLSKPSQRLLDTLAASSISIHLAPVLANGRLELLHYLNEMSVSHDYHRYGNISSSSSKGI
jgi:RHH-type proline utilization regulon transcriptional repressor/proline dehydrogenase/delta 1-pyrroline-5-carboxylate dehydrogenase